MQRDLMCSVIERSIQGNPNISQRQMSDSQFNKQLKAKNPEVNIDKMLDIFNEKYSEIKKIQGTEGFL